MKRLTPMIMVAVLICAVAYFNNRISQVAPPDTSDNSPAAPPTTPSESQVSKQLAAMQPRINVPRLPTNVRIGQAAEELTINNTATAKHRITVGYTYDPFAEINDLYLLGAIEEAAQAGNKSKGSVSVRVVDLDIPVEDRSASTKDIADVGITIDGKQTFQVHGKTINLTDNPGEGSTTGPVLDTILASEAIK